MPIPTPYVGVTGFMSRGEASAVLTDEIRAELHRTGRKLMVGVLASHKTLYGDRIESKRQWRYPKIEDLASIFPNDRQTLNIVHFNTREPNLGEQLERIEGLAGMYFDGIQLNVNWPEHGQLRRWRRKWPSTSRLVIAITGTMVTEFTYKPSVLADRLVNYSDTATDFLFDPSGGYGVPVEFDQAAPFIEAIYGRFGNTHGIGVAGGFSSEFSAVERISQFLKRWPNISIDAEGELRFLINHRTGEDRLESSSARLYVKDALHILK